MKIKVTSDSTCDLSPELLKRYDITTIPLYIRMGEKEYRDGVDITPSDICAHVDAGGDLCSTAAVSVGDYLELFSKFSPGYDAVFHINISAEFSACCQNARTAAAEFSNVYVVDSRNLSSGQGHVVIEAAVKGAELSSPEELFEYLTDLTERVDASFILSRLDYMRKGGRCSAITALGANLLQLKPCIEVAGGKMGVGRKYRGSFEKCLSGYVQDRLKGRENDLELERVFITHTFCDKYVERVRQEVAKCAPFAEVLETRAGCTVTCHCGPGTLGVLYIRRKKKK